ncbi:hypothetical protein C0J52_03675 [Blattella germanica]|nr:hypothetical protein C0J52_03675 [Blattella germanica]
MRKHSRTDDEIPLTHSRTNVTRETRAHFDTLLRAALQHEGNGNQERTDSVSEAAKLSKVQEKKTIKQEKSFDIDNSRKSSIKNTDESSPQSGQMIHSRTNLFSSSDDDVVVRKGILNVEIERHEEKMRRNSNCFNKSTELLIVDKKQKDEKNVNQRIEVNKATNNSDPKDADFNHVKKSSRRKSISSEINNEKTDNPETNFDNKLLKSNETTKKPVPLPRRRFERKTSELCKSPNQELHKLHKNNEYISSSLSPLLPLDQLSTKDSTDDDVCVAPRRTDRKKWRKKNDNVQVDKTEEEVELKDLKASPAVDEEKETLSSHKPSLHKSVVPSWEELLVFNEDFQYILGNNPPVLILFELLDFVNFNVASSQYRKLGSEGGWHHIAWAFLKPLGANGILNIEKQVYQWWNGGVWERYPATIYVTVKGITPPEHLPPVLRSRSALQGELSENPSFLDVDLNQDEGETKSENENSLVSGQMLPHPSFVYCAQFHPGNSSVLVTGCCDHVVRIWNRPSKSSQYELIQELEGHSGFISAITISSNGIIFSADSAGLLIEWKGAKGKTKKQWSLWKLNRNIDVRELRDTVVNKLQLHPGGQRLLIHVRDSRLRMLELSTGSIIQWFNGALNHRVQTSACLSPCGGLVFAASEDGTVRVWNADTGEQMAIYSGLQFHKGANGVDYHPYEHMAAFASYGSPAQVHVCDYDKLSSGKEIGLQLLFHQEVSVLGTSHSGRGDIAESFIKSSTPLGLSHTEAGLSIVKRKKKKPSPLPDSDLEVRWEDSHLTNSLKPTNEGSFSSLSPRSTNITSPWKEYDDESSRVKLASIIEKMDQVLSRTPSRSSQQISDGYKNESSKINSSPRNQKQTVQKIKHKPTGTILSA